MLIIANKQNMTKMQQQEAQQAQQTTDLCQADV